MVIEMTQKGGDTMSVAVDNITKEFLESLRRPQEKLAPPVTIDELAAACEEAFDLYAEPLKVYLLEQERKLQD